MKQYTLDVDDVAKSSRSAGESLGRKTIIMYNMGGVKGQCIHNLLLLNLQTLAIVKRVTQSPVYALKKLGRLKPAAVEVVAEVVLGVPTARTCDCCAVPRV